MEIHSLELGSFMVSAYVVVDGEEAMVVDAPEGAEALVELCRARDLVPKLLVNTHGHVDHIHGNALLKETWPAIEIACGREEAALLESPMRNLSIMMAAWVKSPPPDRLLDEGDEVAVGEARFRVLSTPGHSPGSISLYAERGPEGRPVVFTGDALFAGSVGRTDFPGAKHETLITAIREKLLALPSETAVYPGHGPPTTIGEEAEANPFL